MVIALCGLVNTSPGTEIRPAGVPGPIAGGRETVLIGQRRSGAAVATAAEPMDGIGRLGNSCAGRIPTSRRRAQGRTQLGELLDHLLQLLLERRAIGLDGLAGAPGSA